MRDRKILRVLCCSLIILILSACSHAPAPQINSNQNNSNEITDLALAIRSLSEHVPFADANETSRLLIDTTVELAKQYDMASPALYHNILVNTGFRERGLCCHWAEDLHAKLRGLQSNSLKFDWLVARLGSQLREHNTVVIYPAGSSWENGIVFDPWRNAGIPHWSKVSNDKYPWQPHPLSGRWDILRCK